MLTTLGIDNTKRSCFTQCPKKYYWQFVRHLKPLKGSTALRFGSTYHAFQEEYRRQKIAGADVQYCKANAAIKALEMWDKETNCGQLYEHDYRTFMLCLEVFHSYLKFYTNGDFIPKMAEHVFSIPFLEREEFVINFEGKIDLIGHLYDDPQLSVIDDKTTGYTVYHVFAEKRAQLMGYCWVAHKLHPDFSTLQAYINLAYVKESVTKKKGSVVTTEFHRMPYLYSVKDIENWHTMMMGECERIYKAHITSNFYPVFESCQTKYGACDYITLCGMTNPDEGYIKANFIEKRWEVCAE